MYLFLFLFLLVLNWKPVYYIGYIYFYKKEPKGLQDGLSWYKDLWALVNPFKIDA